MENLEAKVGECALKPVHELVVYETFRVDEVISCSYNINVNPSSEFVAGGECGSYSAGMDSELTLKVASVPVSSVFCPVKELHFSGFSAVRKGDYITVAIPRFESEFVSKNNNCEFAVDRPYHKKETAIEIAILENAWDPKAQIMRTDRSVHYDRFQKS